MPYRSEFIPVRRGPRVKLTCAFTNWLYFASLPFSVMITAVGRL